LRRVGLTRTGGAFDALADPIATDALAALLAEKSQPFGPAQVVVWYGLNSTVLGYGVGVRLGIPVLVLSDDEGLVSAATPPRVGARAVLVAPTTPEPAIVRMTASYLEDQGVALVAMAVLLGSSDGHDIGQKTEQIALAERLIEAGTLGDLPRAASEPPGRDRREPPPRQDRR
jgi:hypothetical protein